MHERQTLNPFYTLYAEYTSDVFVLEGQKVADHLGKAADEGFEVDLHELFLKMTLDSFGT